jgi:hypothetical protein
MASSLMEMSGLSKDVRCRNLHASVDTFEVSVGPGEPYIYSCIIYGDLEGSAERRAKADKFCSPNEEYR